jgi:hypothetical protein
MPPTPTSSARPHLALALCLFAWCTAPLPGLPAQSAIAWGDNSHGQCNVPGLPIGVTYREVACGARHSVARRSDGTIVAWGDNTAGQCNVPPLPGGHTWLEIAAGEQHTLARRSDGVVLACGDDSFGQCNVPPLPPGLTFVAIAAGARHSLAVRSDGALLAWGDGTAGQCNVPLAAPGLPCLGIAAGAAHSLARFADGSLLAFGDDTYGQCSVPTLPPGADLDRLAAGGRHSLVRCRDGRVFAWGDDGLGQCTLPTLPPSARCMALAAGTGHTLLRLADGFVQCLGDDTTGQATPPVLPPGRVYHDVAAGAGHSLATYGAPRPASNTTIGHGCDDHAQSFYETFHAPLVAFDLGHRTLRLTFTGGGYQVERVAPAFTPPSAPDLGLADNTLATIALPFVVPYPGGVTQQLAVGDNGCVFLQPSQAAAAFSGAASELLQGAARHAPLWHDFDPATGTGSGTVHVDIDAVQQQVLVTWLQVATWGEPNATATFQLLLAGTGLVEYRYLGCAPNGAALVGWSPGGGVPDPGPRDLTTVPPFQTVPWFAAPLQQVATSLPELGMPWQLETRQIPASAWLGFSILGLADPGLPDLAAVGMPGCGLFASLDHVTTFVPNGPDHGTTLWIPADQALVGRRLFATAAVATWPATNAFGLLTGNGIVGRVGAP